MVNATFAHQKQRRGVSLCTRQMWHLPSLHEIYSSVFTNECDIFERRKLNSCKSINLNNNIYSNSETSIKQRPKDWQKHLFAITRFRYIELLFHIIYYNWICRLDTSRPLGERSEPFLAAKRPTARGPASRTI